MNLKIRCRHLLGLLLSMLAFNAHAQVVVSGHVTDAKTGAPLFPATVLDVTTGMATYADSTGYYVIKTNPGDILLFKYIGFYRDKYVVPARLEYVTHDVALLSKREKLKPVDVTALTPYQQDSLERVETFSHYLDQPIVRFTDRKTAPSFGLGFIFHPFTYFSKVERRKRKFHKMYKGFEEDAFVDSRYTPQLVHRLTGLSKDSLHTFMFHHRPPYAFTRYASQLEFWSWITRNCRKWRDSLQAAKPR